MTTKALAIAGAQHTATRTGKPAFIFRVGSQWMTDTRSLEEIQATYKRKIAEYQEVLPKLGTR